MRQIQVLGMVNDERLHFRFGQGMDEPGTAHIPGHGGDKAQGRTQRHSQRQVFSPLLGSPNRQNGDLGSSSRIFV